jgi:hypothetical protein
MQRSLADSRACLRTCVRAQSQDTQADSLLRLKRSKQAQLHAASPGTDLGFAD